MLVNIEINKSAIIETGVAAIMIKKSGNIKNLMEKHGAVVYGMGRIGQNVYSMLENSGCSLLMAWDKNASNLYDSIGIESLSEPVYDYLNKQIPIIICINAKKIYESVLKELIDHGFANVYWIREVENDQLCEYSEAFLPRECNMCVINRGGCKGYLDSLRDDRNTVLPISELTIVPTYICSLSCKYCSEKVYEMKKNNVLINADEEVLRNAISNMVAAIGWLRQVNIFGGEIFLYKDWPQIVRNCLSNVNIGIVHLLTNGVCRINDSDISILKHEKIVIEMDDYGEKISESKRRIFENTKRLFDNNDINYSIVNNKAGTWYDFGSFEERGSSAEELEFRYANCPGTGCMILDPEGYFTICGRQSFADALGEKINIEGEKIKVLDYSVAELRSSINKLMSKKYLKMCNYCDGARVIVSAGEQVDATN